MILGAPIDYPTGYHRSVSLWIDADGWVQHPGSATAAGLVRWGRWTVTVVHRLQRVLVQTIELADGHGYSIEIKLELRPRSR